ncbi:MAG: hypothetical protein A3F68_05740 [Acidobacteria bacterium RIFCSPLOWO2_12_FULL_54_10]|nr:MAG: hypothetical protein A3F68_05740 [Acidobacteria bacterium RIFCSPLOWO2_12_FULL_54_10]
MRGRRKIPSIGLRSGKKKIIYLILSLLLTIGYAVRRNVIPIPRTSDSSGCSGTAACISGFVERVIDGDTLEVGGQRIRLVLVNAPERGTRGAPEATEFLREMCPAGAAALVDQDDLQLTDDYGRMLAVVWCNGKRVNEEIIRAGRAKIYGRFCRKSEFGMEPWAIALGCE